jgi:TRAP transporter TAXI family solute receptor
LKWLIALKRPILALLIGIGSAQAIAAPSPIVIVTGPVAGFAFPLGGEICRLYDEAAADKARCLVSPSNGSVDDIDRLRAGEVGLAIVQSDIATDAVHGTGVFTGKPPFADLRSITGFYTNALTLLVRRDGPVKQTDDLKGNRIAVGEIGASDPLFNDFMDSMGWTKADLAIEEMPRGEQIAALCNGKIAAIAVTAPHPNGFVREALSTCPVQALDIPVPIVDNAVSAYPAYAPVHVDMGMYGGQAYSIDSFGPRAVMVTTVKLDREIATRLLTGLFGHIDALDKAHPAFAGLDKAALGLGLGLGAERHPAAVKYMTDNKIADTPNDDAPKTDAPTGE